MKIRGIIFDLDGTLGDTLPVCCAAFRVALREYTGRDYDDAEIRSLFGPSEEGMIRSLVPDRAEDCLELYLSEYQRVHDSVRAPFAGLGDALRGLTEHGVLMAIVTGKGPRSAAISLRQMGLDGRFDPVEAGSPRGGVKAEKMARVLETWNLPAEKVASVGDAPTDVRAARAVGVVPLAAAWASTADPERLASAGPEQLFQTVEAFRQWIGQQVL